MERSEVDIALRDRTHPRLAAAARIGNVRHAGAGQVVVVARDVAAHQVSNLGNRSHRRRLAEHVAHQVAIDQPLPVEVALQVGDRLPSVAGALDPEKLRSLGAYGHPAIRDGANVGGREGVAVAESRAGQVIGAHVDDTVGGGADSCLERLLLRVGGQDEGGLENQQGKQSHMQPQHQRANSVATGDPAPSAASLACRMARAAVVWSRERLAPAAARGAVNQGSPGWETMASFAI
jgi:hypothetical protein